MGKLRTVNFFSFETVAFFSRAILRKPSGIIAKLIWLLKLFAVVTAVAAVWLGAGQVVPAPPHWLAGSPTVRSRTSRQPLASKASDRVHVLLAVQRHRYEHGL